MFIFAVISFFDVVCGVGSRVSTASLKWTLEELQFLALLHRHRIFRPGFAAFVKTLNGRNCRAQRMKRHIIVLIVQTLLMSYEMAYMK